MLSNYVEILYPFKILVKNFYKKMILYILHILCLDIYVYVNDDKKNINGVETRSLSRETEEDYKGSLTKQDIRKVSWSETYDRLQSKLKRTSLSKPFKIATVSHAKWKSRIICNHRRQVACNTGSWRLTDYG